MDEDYTDLDDGFQLLGSFLIMLIACLVAFIVGFTAGEGLGKLVVPTSASVRPQPRPLTYDEQHLLAYDFMVDNPHVRQELCSHRFLVQPMDSDRGVK